MEKVYKPIIGLEIHLELNTKSKMFCQCSADVFDAPPNYHLCPVCLGLPGALPVPNKNAIEKTILLGLALGCKINSQTKFDRKHYFYPDLPKGYQISQYDEPIGIEGELKVYFSPPNNTINQSFRIRRVHLEEDTGKLIHLESETLVDFNRSGLALVEIVTEPDFENSFQVKAFLEELYTVIKYLRISDADLEKGSLRFEPNISIAVREKNGTFKLPEYKVEIKNINSFRFVKQAIDYEIERQISILNKGKIPFQETRGFDPKKGITFNQRRKETAQDYRYFPEPDIPPIQIDKNWLEEIKNRLPILPYQHFNKLIKKDKIKPSDAYIITRDPDYVNYFENLLEYAKNDSILNKLGEKLPQALANLLINKKVSSQINPKDFLAKAREILNPAILDKSSLEVICLEVIKENQKAVLDYKSGKEAAIMFLVGQTMKKLKTKTDANIIIEILKSKINS